jgi:hypothetical protein
VNDGLTALSQLSGGGGSTPPAELGDRIGQYEAIQTPLLSSDNSFVAGFGELLFNGPDQQLVQRAESFLSAADAYAADPTSLTNTADVLSATFQWTDSLLFDSVPANAIGKLLDQIAGNDIASAGAATDLAASASSASDTPDDVIAQAISDLDEGTALLDAAPTADLSAQQASVLSEQAAVRSQEDPLITAIAASQEGLSATDQTFLANADEQLVTAAQNLLSADQTFVAADQAGDLSGNSFASVALTAFLADGKLLSATFNSLADTFLATAFPDIGSFLPRTCQAMHPTFVGGDCQVNGVTGCRSVTFGLE